MENAGKFHIEKNTVQETLVIPLYAKKCCTERFPQFFKDPSAVKLVENIDYDFSVMKENFLTRFGMLEAGMRVKDLVWEIKDYLKIHPKAAVVNLGCGLDDMMQRVDNGRLTMYNLDFPDVMDIRNKLMPPAEREINIPADLTDHNWMEKIKNADEDGCVLAASGVFYYFQAKEMKNLLIAMERNFPTGRLAFDTGNEKALKLMLKEYIKGSNMEIDAYFCLDDPKDLEKWVPRSRVSQKGYMTGYEKLDSSIPLIYRELAKFGDKVYGLRIVRIDF